LLGVYASADLIMKQSHFQSQFHFILRKAGHLVPTVLPQEYNGNKNKDV
jgi:hypothetical protein